MDKLAASAAKELVAAAKAAGVSENTFKKYLEMARTNVVVISSRKYGNYKLVPLTEDDTIISADELDAKIQRGIAEYEKGNYCVAGGDFNKDLPGNSAELFGVPAPKDSNWAQPIPEGVISPELTLIVPLHEDAPVASCRTASESYDPATTFRITVDGFIVSANVDVLDSDVIDTGYAYSDHNPIYLQFVLK